MKEKTSDTGKQTSQDAFSTFQVKSKIVFLIPEADNSGNAFSNELFDWIDKSLCNLGGGYHYHQIFGGCITEDDVVQRENCRKYYVGIDEKQVPEMLQLLIQAKQVFQQKELYVELEGKIIFL